MTRAEIRRQNRENEKKTAVYTLTAGQIEEIKRDCTSKGIEAAFMLMLSLPLLVLHDKFGFGNKRLTQFITELDRLRDCTNEDRLTLKDIVDEVYRSTGIKLEGRLNGRKLEL